MNDSAAQKSRGSQLIRNVVPLLKWLLPKFHNRITWVVAGTGLALAASPWWVEVVAVIVADIFHREISIPDHPWIGITLVGIALLYHLAMTCAQSYYPATSKSTASADHDRGIFEIINSIMTENDLTETLDNIDKHQAIFSSQIIMMKDVSRLLSMHDGQFIDIKMQTASSAFQSTLDELLNFIGKSFFTDDEWTINLVENKFRYVLYPEINGKRSPLFVTQKQQQIFSEAEEEMGNRIDDLKEKYDLFRQAVKSTLMS